MRTTASLHPRARALVQAVIVSFGTAVIEFFSQGRPVVFIPYGLINPLLLMVPRLAYRRSTRLRQLVRPEWLERIESLELVIILLSAPASLLFHPLGIQYDRFLHAAATALTYWLGLFLYLPLHQSLNGAPVTKRVPLVVMTSLSVVYIFFGEGYEFGLDRLFGSALLGGTLFSDAAQSVRVDLGEDIALGALGTLIATASAWRFFDWFAAVLQRKGAR